MSGVGVGFTCYVSLGALTWAVGLAGNGRRMIVQYLSVYVFFLGEDIIVTSSSFRPLLH